SRLSDRTAHRIGRARSLGSSCSLGRAGLRSQGRRRGSGSRWRSCPEGGRYTPSLRRSGSAHGEPDPPPWTRVAVSLRDLLLLVQRVNGAVVVSGRQVCQLPDLEETQELVFVRLRFADQLGQLGGLLWCDWFGRPILLLGLHVRWQILAGVHVQA